MLLKTFHPAVRLAIGKVVLVVGIAVRRVIFDVAGGGVVLVERGQVVCRVGQGDPRRSSAVVVEDLVSAAQLQRQSKKTSASPPRAQQVAALLGPNMRRTATIEFIEELPGPKAGPCTSRSDPRAETASPSWRARSARPPVGPAWTRRLTVTKALDTVPKAVNRPAPGRAQSLNVVEGVAAVPRPGRRA